MSSTAANKLIGVLTGGGDCPGLNAVIRTVPPDGDVVRTARALGIGFGDD